MPAEWEIISKEVRAEDLLATITDFGLSSPDPTYIIRNKETGEIKEVKAGSDKELGRRISRGDFDS